MLIHFAYCRKSSEDEDRQIISNESQEKELTPLAVRDQLTIRSVIKEEASAKVAGSRRRFNDMVKRIKKGEANAILCWHLNRLSRNAMDAAALVDLMDQGKLSEIRTPGQTFRNTPGDKFLITLFCSQAKLENDNKGVDVKRGLRAKATMGMYPGVAPMGYLNDKTKNRGERDLYKDPDRFVLIKKMWQMLLSGTYTTPQIVEIANENWGFRTRRTKKQGGIPLTVSSLYHVFHNPFYYGWFEYPAKSGNWYQGKHEPMVTKAEYDRVQALLGQRGNPRSKTLTFSYSGVIHCGSCAGMVTAEEKHHVRCTVCRKKFSCKNVNICPQCETPIVKMVNPQFRDYTYYHCARRKGSQCKQRSIDLSELEYQIEGQLRRIKISDSFKQWAFQYLEEIYKDDIKSLQSVSVSRDRTITEYTMRLERLIELKTSPTNADGSLISDEEYGKQRQELIQARATLQSEQGRMGAQQALRQSQEAFDFANSALIKFQEGDSLVKKKVLLTIGSNHTLKDKILLIEAYKPFILISDFNSDATPQIGGIEPEKSQVKQGQKSPTKHANLSQLRDVKEVRTDTSKIKTLVAKVYHHYRSGVDAIDSYIWN